MKKYLALIVFLPGFLWAQEQNEFQLGSNEIKFDVASAIAVGRYQLSYERFIADSWSVGISGILVDSKSQKRDFETGNSRTLEDFEIIPFVRYSLSKSKIRYYFIEVFASYNSGSYRQLERLVDNGIAYYGSVSYDYSDVALGGAIGHKFYLKEKFSVDIFVGAGKNLFQDGKSPDIISRVGLNLGYRF